jgi:hypothetical protein
VVFLAAAATCFVGFVFTWFLPEMRLRSHQDDKDTTIAAESQATEEI